MASYLTHRPARGNITHRYGAGAATPTSPKSHTGTDFGWGGGTSIYAARAGRVKSYARVGSYGNRLVIDHGDGHETWYCHLQSASASVSEHVDGGEKVAVMGATGNVTAKHLHFMLVINRKHTNPEPHLPSASTAETVSIASIADIGLTILEDDMGDATEASVQESIRIGNVLYVQNLQVLEALHAATLRDTTGATEASVQESIRVSNETWERAGRVLSKPSYAIDPVKLAAALNAAGLTVTIDADAIAAAVDESLRDDFAAIPAAVIGGFKTAL